MAGSPCDPFRWMQRLTLCWHQSLLEAALGYVAVDRLYALHDGVEEASAPVALLPGVDAASLAPR